MFDSLVTGANGFIGRHLVRYLYSKNEKVVITDREPFGVRNPKSDDYTNTVLWDIQDKPPKLPSCRIWYHLAANTDVSFCNKYPRQAYSLNAQSLTKVLQAAENTGCEKFIFVSTLGVYGNPNYLPTDEMHPNQPFEVYANSKSKAEKILLNYQPRSNLKRVIVRPFNTYGSGQRATMLIPSLINQVTKSNIVKVQNIDCSRDFIYVDDLVRGLYKCGQSASDGDIINLGTGVETSIAQLVDTLGIAIDQKLKIESSSFQPSYNLVKRSQADIGRANSILGWYPRVLLLDGLRITINESSHNF